MNRDEAHCILHSSMLMITERLNRSGQESVYWINHVMNIYQISKTSLAGEFERLFE